ncbi:MAG: hypothetical protein QM651_16040, partial [Rhodoblastus sp.]
MMADLYVAFGGDTAALEAAASVVKQELSALQRDMTALAKEFRRTGAEADSELGRSLKKAGEEMAVAREKSRDLNAELKKIGAGDNDNFRNLSRDFRKFTESVADNAYELGPWTGTHVEMAKLATLGLSNALAGANKALGAMAIGLGATAAAAAAAVAIIA